MQASVIQKFIKTSPRKLRLVADTIRSLKPTTALEQLEMMEKRAAGPLALAVKSAIANAVNNAKLTKDTLIFKSIIIEEGPVLKRWRPVSRGRAHPFKRRMSHIRIVLSDDQDQNSKLKTQK